MRKRPLPFGILILALLATSCYSEVVLEDGTYVELPPNSAMALESHDLWVVDLGQTLGTGEIPFVQNAFTLSFDRGLVHANNNLVGIGKQGDGLGLDVGLYDLYGNEVEIQHDLDGLWVLEVHVLGPNTLRLRDSRSNTSYLLRGYSRTTFDYDRLFYDNIHYFLQEYRVWEKTYTSALGSPNEFDAENYLQFHADGGGYFRSSIDPVGLSLDQIQWDYQGDYTVYDVVGDPGLKTLTLDYDSSADDYFELYILDDSTVELYHVPSGTLYEFMGRGYRQFLKSSGDVGRERSWSPNPTMDVERQRKM